MPTTTITFHPTPSLTIRITFQPHAHPVRVTYADVDDTVPTIYDTAQFDYILHVGVGIPGGFELEKIAWGTGYNMGDVDGLVPGGGEAKDDETLKKQGLFRNWAGGGSGGSGSGGSGDSVMGTALDVNWIVGMVEQGVIKLSPSGSPGERMFTATLSDRTTESSNAAAGADEKKKTPNPKRPAATKKSAKTGYKIRTSEDAGRYLCEYIYRRSLEQAIHRQQTNTRKPWEWHNSAPDNMSRRLRPKDNISKRVLFMHVPPEGNIYSIEQDIDCLMQVVVGMVMDGEGLRRVQ